MGAEVEAVGLHGRESRRCKCRVDLLLQRCGQCAGAVWCCRRRRKRGAADGTRKGGWRRRRHGCCVVKERLQWWCSGVRRVLRHQLWAAAQHGELSRQVVIDFMPCTITMSNGPLEQSHLLGGKTASLLECNLPIRVCSSVNCLPQCGQQLFRRATSCIGE